MSNVVDDVKFSLGEISRATGIDAVFKCGISYGAVELHVPLVNGRVLIFREGDDVEDDHEVRVEGGER